MTHSLGDLRSFIEEEPMTNTQTTPILSGVKVGDWLAIDTALSNLKPLIRQATKVTSKRVKAGYRTFSLDGRCVDRYCPGIRARPATPDEIASHLAEKDRRRKAAVNAKAIEAERAADPVWCLWWKLSAMQDVEAVETLRQFLEQTGADEKIP